MKIIEIKSGKVLKEGNRRSIVSTLGSPKEPYREEFIKIVYRYQVEHETTFEKAFQRSWYNVIDNFNKYSEDYRVEDDENDTEKLSQMPNKRIAKEYTPQILALREAGMTHSAISQKLSL